MCTCVKVIHSARSKARIEYYDDGWDYIQGFISEGCYVPGPHIGSPPNKITFAEGRILVAHKNRPNPHKILKGERYVRQFNEMDGELYIFRMNEELYKMACKYSLFEAYC